jgi:murein DD-endopeptidase MepM/ murein hydrolase activator NlpD
LASTSAAELLQRCLQGESWTDNLLRDAMAEDSGRAFFRVVVEGLGDRFEPRLCDEYARLFAKVIEIVRPDCRAPELINRFERVRQPRICTQDPEHVFVLSRVTLGADACVTSIVLDAAKRRFPEANIYLVGSRKNWELFAAEKRILHRPFDYARAGSVDERLREWPRFDTDDSIVIDPDSRLSQLGLLPVCDEDRYYFFESRSYGGDSADTLVQLTRKWVASTFGVHDARNFVSPEIGPMTADIAVSFGVGENAEKRIGDPFEEVLLRSLAATGHSVLIDQGADGEESARVQRLCERVPGIRSWKGAYAPFAYAIANAKRYVGYDSAGQHVAAACGTPLLSIFAGYATERMFQRWRPDGPGKIDVLKVADRDPRKVLDAALQYLTL